MEFTINYKDFFKKYGEKNPVDGNYMFYTDDNCFAVVDGQLMVVQYSPLESTEDFFYFEPEGYEVFELDNYIEDFIVAYHRKQELDELLAA